MRSRAFQQVTNILAQTPHVRGACHRLWIWELTNVEKRSTQSQRAAYSSTVKPKQARIPHTTAKSTGPKPDNLQQPAKASSVASPPHTKKTTTPAPSRPPPSPEAIGRRPNPPSTSQTTAAGVSRKGPPASLKEQHKAPHRTAPRPNEATQAHAPLDTAAAGYPAPESDASAVGPAIVEVQSERLPPTSTSSSNASAAGGPGGQRRPSEPSQLRAAGTAFSAQWSHLNPRLRSGLPFLAALVAGLCGGAWLTRAYVFAPPPLEPGSAEDAAELARFEAAADDLFLVKVLRGKALAAGRVIRGEGATPAPWVELPPQPARGAGGERVDALGGVRRAELSFEREKLANREQVAAREAQIVASAGEELADGKERGEVNLGNEGSKEHRIEGLKQQAEALGLTLDANATTTTTKAGSSSDNEDTAGAAAFGRQLWDDEGVRTLMRDTLGGSAGLAGERAFWNGRDGELVVVVRLGKGLCGWPGVVHGGLLATLLLDKVAVAAKLYRDGSAEGHDDPGVPALASPPAIAADAARAGDRLGHDGAAIVRDWRRLSSLDIQYKKPTYAGAFHVVRATPRALVPGGDRRRGALEVDASLETLEGQVCVTVKGVLPGSEAEPSAAAFSLSGWLRDLHRRYF